MAQANSNRARIARTGIIAAKLARLYPQAKISLDFSTPWECLVATILSAQCTDERVNQVTPSLFKAIPNVQAMASSPLPKIERLIVTTGFYHQKAKALKGAAAAIVTKFDGEVPHTMEELTTLPGVGRKTANVILGHVYGEPGMVVDTHVRRLANRLGLAKGADADKIELELQSLLPPSNWTAFSMRLILHGRRICYARRPRCDVCAILPECPQIDVEPKLPGRFDQIKAAQR